MLSIKEMKDKTIKFVKGHKLETAGLIVGSIIVGEVATKSKTKVTEVVEALPVPDTTPEVYYDWIVGESRYWCMDKANVISMDDVIEELTAGKYTSERL